MRDIISSKIHNVGSLTSFLRNPKNIDILNYLNNNIPIGAKDLPIPEKLWYFLGYIKEMQVCECGKKLIFTGPKNGYRTSCGDKECYVKNRRKTCIEKYGVDNPQKVKDFNDKSKATIQERHNNPIIDKPKEKSTPKIKENLNGIVHTPEYKNVNVTPINKEEIANKIKKLIPLNYTYTNHYYNKIETSTLYEVKHDLCNKNSIYNRAIFKKRIKGNEELCFFCNPVTPISSNMAVAILDFIKENYEGEIITNSNTIIENGLDIYIPALNFAIEFNELYWHCELHKDKLYHLNKTIECLSKGISLVHIWEDDWRDKSEVIKSMILNKLGKSIKIYARKCIIKEVDDNSLIRDFCNRNHIQGFTGSKIKIGLFYENRMVSLITFGGLRKNMGQVVKEGSYELMRFCSELNHSIVGGASKLFNYFLQKYNPIDVISYSDYSRSVGGMYQQLGFKLLHLSQPNYYYIIDDKRSYRFLHRKDVLVKQGFDPNMTEVDIMHSCGYYRLFDCGMEKWKYTHQLEIN